MERRLRIALSAHDRRKSDMLEWAAQNARRLSESKLYATERTGELVMNKLQKMGYYVDMDLKHPAAMGGDAEIASLISLGEIDFCIFLWDDLHPQSEMTDLRMLLRQSRIHNVAVACNRTTADHLICSPLWDDMRYVKTKPHYVELDDII